MQRPGPLQELPLELFLPAVRPNKRPHSPEAPVLFSPTKRRILNDEGVFSPEKSYKTPLPFRRGPLASPSHFSKVLAGPDSPARMLDFGLPKNNGDPEKHRSSSTQALDATPVRNSASNVLSPSPELKPKTGRTTSSRTLRTQSDPDDINDNNDPTLPSSPIPTSLLSFVPRELPPQLNPHSIHYPGFHIFQDPHTIIYPKRDQVPIIERSKDNEFLKENLPPRRKMPKSSTTWPPSSSDYSTRDGLSSIASPPNKLILNDTERQTTAVGIANKPFSSSPNLLSKQGTLETCRS